MNEMQVAKLRKYVEAAKLEGAQVQWTDSHGDVHMVRAVSSEPVDPDKTGIKDYVAYLDRGHVDLANVEPESFSYAVITPIF